MSEKLMDWTFNRDGAKACDYALDMDSLVFTRYGSQEWAREGYNPRKPGRPSNGGTRKASSPLPGHSPAVVTARGPVVALEETFTLICVLLHDG